MMGGNMVVEAGAIYPLRWPIPVFVSVWRIWSTARACCAPPGRMKSSHTYIGHRAPLALAGGRQPLSISGANSGWGRPTPPGWRTLIEVVPPLLSGVSSQYYQLRHRCRHTETAVVYTGEHQLKYEYERLCALSCTEIDEPKMNPAFLRGPFAGCASRYRYLKLKLLTMPPCQGSI
ncbi:hypothetical protein PENSPDRAFT_434949 [Peniophora sp. CONT]|nr:hypothetical protein PENSPDRAFT_434949 [Peniophora sp. CONT]